ncbi:hypothetical protein D3C80_1584450 [compost metagenome]
MTQANQPLLVVEANVHGAGGVEHQLAAVVQGKVTNFTGGAVNISQPVLRRLAAIAGPAAKAQAGGQQQTLEHAAPGQALSFAALQGVEGQRPGHTGQAPLQLLDPRPGPAMLRGAGQP